MTHCSLSALAGTVPCNKALRQCWAQREPSCCKAKNSNINKIISYGFKTLKASKKARFAGKHLPSRERLHPYWNRICVDWGGGNLYCLTTKNSLWPNETRWTTMHTKVDRSSSLFALLLHFLKISVTFLQDFYNNYLEIFK